MPRRPLVLAFAALALARPAAADGLATDFDTVDWCDFDPAQTDMDRFDVGSETIDGRTRTFVMLRADGALRNTLNAERPAGTECADAPPPAPRAEAPPPAAPKPPTSRDLGQFANCPVEIRDYQRNEMRLAERFSHWPEEGHWYGITFRLDGAVPTCGSTRQVIAQWKIDYRDVPKSFEPSPVLALRVDNGVLHATVQSGSCRCTIAQSEGDPHFVAGTVMTLLPPGPPPLARLQPVCDNQCRPDPSLVLEGVVDGPRIPMLPDLPDPRAGWVTIHAFILNRTAVRGEPGRGLIELYADGRPVARVTDGVGYGEGVADRVRFKFGQYRYRIAAQTRALFDALCVDVDRARCGPAETFAERYPGR